MFESAEIGHKIGKAAFKSAVPALRAALQGHFLRSTISGA